MSNNSLEKNNTDELNILDEEEWCKVTFNKYIKNPTDIYKFTKHLIGLINEITPEDELLLFLFLQTTFHYKSVFEKKNDFGFLNLGFMAELLESEQDDDGSYQEPLYDLILRAAIKNTSSEKHNNVKSYYTLFNEARNKDSIITIIYYICIIIINYKAPE